MQKMTRQRLLIVMFMAGAFYLTMFFAPWQAEGASKQLDFDETVSLYNSGDNKQALRNFWRLAAKGNAKAQFYLATMLDSGTGTNKDIFSAVSWYLKSARQDYLPAVAYVGYIYSTGYGVRKDDKEAFKWYTSADGGCQRSE